MGKNDTYSHFQLINFNEIQNTKGIIETKIINNILNFQKKGKNENR